MNEVDKLFIENNRFLDNKFPCKIIFNGLIFESAESAFWAQKNPANTREFVGINGYVAKSLARQIEAAPKWNENKQAILQEIVFQKFLQNVDLRLKLFEAKDEDIIEFLARSQNRIKKIKNNMIEIDLIKLMLDIRQQLMEIKIPKLSKEFISESITKDIITRDDLKEIKLDYILLKDDPTYNFLEDTHQYETNIVLKYKQKASVNIVLATGIVFSDDPWTLLVECPRCRRQKELVTVYNKDTRTFKSDYNFCEYCGNEIDWNIEYKM